MRINVPPVTRALILLTCSFSFVCAAARWNIPLTAEDSTAEAPDRSIPYLTLVPSKSLYYPWTVLTSIFVEQNILNFLINTTAVYLSGKYLERAWGSKDFAIVALVGAVIPNLLVIPTYVLWGTVTRNTTRADTPIAGAITLQAAFLVAFKQLVPEHTVSLYKGLIKIRVKHFPAIFLLLNTLSGIVFGTDTALLLAWYGLIITWIYLRFFKYQPELGTSTGGMRLKGDASETFAFPTFFPNAIQPPIAAVCDQVYILCCNMKIMRPFSDEAVASSNEQAMARGEAGLPTVMSRDRGARPMSRREEAERRRALALKALDERLNAANSQSSVASSAAPMAHVDQTQQPSTAA
ncbi:hypothetical protein LTR70_002998 [Exophiala xenobiotica]|uniref:Uncharacterized protein n=1 Tax=Lithohypha guttulata TaxID=1690604 RepID=A0ABR0K8Z7_9EURO|nr:hypothetical protein LTR24_005678 [Lithohypha guttulata]KAK5324368.1 hypothetical protein LTR70_002998 [Exophiala xenobiotica]